MIKFSFNGIDSDDMGVIISRIENNDTLITRQPITGEKNKYRPKENYFGTLYSDNYSFTLGLAKNPCKQNNYTFTSNDIKKINSWLTSPQYPKEFKFIDNPYYDEEIHFFVIITEVTTEHIDNPNELIFTVTCDSPYGYTPEIKISTESSSIITNKIVITNNSDDLETYVYPLFKIKPLDNSNLTIKNITDNNKSITVTMLKDDEFYIDCQKLQICDITGSLISFDDLGIADVDQIYFPRLRSGKNELEFKGNAEIEIIYREPRKVGAFYGTS